MDERERKFLLEPAAADAFLAAIAHWTRPVVHDPGRPVSFTRTTYLDTPALDYLRSDATGLARRLRIREYASALGDECPDLSSQAYLELKETAQGHRRKTRLRADRRTLLDLLQGREVAEDALEPADAASAEARAALIRSLRVERPLPCVSTWYRRRAFADGEERIRITVDDRLAFYPPLPLGSSLTEVEPIDRKELRVLEVKQTGGPPPWLEPLLECHRESVGFSKFRMAMSAALRAAGQSAWADGSGT